MLVAAAALGGGCGSEPEAEPIPTTLPVLTTLRPQLTTTTMAPPPPQRCIYTVQPNEYLGFIASRFGISVQEILDENTIADPTRIYPGQDLVIPPTVAGNCPR